MNQQLREALRRKKFPFIKASDIAEPTEEQKAAEHKTPKERRAEILEARKSRGE